MLLDVHVADAMFSIDRTWMYLAAGLSLVVPLVIISLVVWKGKIKFWGRVYLPLALICAFITLPIFIESNFQAYIYDDPEHGWTDGVPLWMEVYNYLLDIGSRIVLVMLIFLAGAFIRHCLDIGVVKKSSWWKLFIPLYGLWLIANYLRVNAVNSRQRSSAIALAFFGLIYQFFTIIAPFLIIVDIDVYSWYIDLVFPPVEGEEYYGRGYTFYADATAYMGRSLRFIGSVTALAAYSSTDMKVVKEETETTVLDDLG